jgi:hypothetical protein
MRIRALIGGNDGTQGFQPGDELTGDTEFNRRLLANGVAEPLDEQAQALLEKPELMERYITLPLQRLADNLRGDA